MARCTLLLLYFLLRVSWGLTHDDDVTTLHALRDGAESDLLRTLWVGDDPCGSGWLGLTCDCDGATSPSRVCTIDIVGIPLNVELPQSMANMASMQRITISGAQLTGTLFDFQLMTALQTIDLSRNSLEGPIPESLFNVPTLKRVDLQENELSGSIPSSIGNAAGLQTMFLFYNNLEGEIPSEIGNLAAMQNLFLHENKLTGSIPTSIFQLTNLVSLALGDNQLSGTLPEDIGNLQFLQQLFLERNQLSGPLPEGIGSLTGLISLSAQNNQFSGPLPSTLGDIAATVVDLDLSSNELEGSLDVFLNFPVLRALKTYNNKFDCPLPLALVDKFYSLVINDTAVKHCSKICPSGSQSAPLATSGCEQCPKGTFKSSDSDADCSICSPGSFTSWVGSAECTPCPTGARCDGGSQFLTMPGYWTPDEQSFVPSECKNEGDCQGELNCGGDRCGGDSQCSDNQSGVLCSSCQEGYFMFAGVCSVCPDPSTNDALVSLTWLGFFLLICGLVTLTFKNSAKAKGGSTKLVVVMINFLQITALAGEFRTRWPQVIEDFLAAFGNASAPDIVFSSDCLAVEFGTHSAFVRSAFYAVLPLSTIVGPLLVLPALYGISRAVSKPLTKHTLQIIYMSVVISTLFLTYTRVTKAILSLFACRDVASTEYLESDMSIVCGSDDHEKWKWAVGVPGLVIYAMGIPALGLTCLMLIKKRSDEPFKNIDNRKAFGVLFMGYREEHYYWEIVVALRKFLMAVIVVFGAPKGPLVQSLAALVVLVFALILQQWTKPFRTVSLNIFETTSLSASFLIVWAGAFFNLPSCSSGTQTLNACLSDSDKDGITGVIMFTIFVTLVVWVFLLALSLRNEGRLTRIWRLCGLNSYKQITPAEQLEKGPASEPANSEPAKDELEKDIAQPLSA